MNEHKPGQDRRVALRARAFVSAEGAISGHVLDPDALERRFVVELLLDGFPAALARADFFDADLAREGLGDGCYGFAFVLDPAVAQSARRAEVRLANSGGIVGAPLDLAAPALAADASGSPGEARWDGGLRFSGWIAAGAADSSRVRAVVDGETVADALATRWTHVGDGASLRARRRFDLFLPERFADGRAHGAVILDDNDAELDGSPCAFIAFPDGLAHFLDSRAEIESERPRGALFDLVAPRSFPFERFVDWRRAFPLAPPEAAAPPPKIAVALIGEADLDATIASLEAQQGCGWIAGALEAHGPAGFDPAALRFFLDGDAADCPLALFALSGSALAPQALALLAHALDAFPDAPLAYADFTFADGDDAEWPVALPAFDYELMLEQGCGALFFAARADHVRAALDAGASDLFGLFFAAQNRRARLAPAAAPIHQPGFLARLPQLDREALSAGLARAAEAHLAVRGMPARVSRGEGALLPTIRVARQPTRATVSILIPTRDGVGQLAACVDALRRTADLSRHEILVMDSDSADPATADGFRSLGARILRVEGPYDPSRLFGAGAAAARGDLLLLLDPAVEPLAPGWLDEMLGRMAEADVGAVGPALVRPSGIVHAAGLVAGPCFSAAPAFADCLASEPGYGDRLRVAHECSAIPLDCLLTRKELFVQSGGLDARYGLFAAVDYGLRLRADGWRIVLTPHARLLTRAANGLDPHSAGDGPGPRALRRLRAAWRDALACDPNYHPMLSLDPTPFSALAWPPRPSGPRLPVVAAPHPVPPGF
jgi:hypothetical protein